MGVYALGLFFIILLVFCVVLVWVLSLPCFFRVCWGGAGEVFPFSCWQVAGKPVSLLNLKWFPAMALLKEAQSRIRAPAL